MNMPEVALAPAGFAFSACFAVQVTEPVHYLSTAAGSYATQLREFPECPGSIGENDDCACSDRPLHAGDTCKCAGYQRSYRRKSDIHEHVGRHHAAAKRIWHD